MPQDDLSAQLVQSQLEAAIAQLESAASQGHHNYFDIRALGSAAKVLGKHEIADRAERILQALPDRAFWAGAITNMELPEKVPQEMRTVGTVAELENRHPRYSTEKMISQIRASASTERHLGHCLRGRFEKARAIAGSERPLEDVGDTAAVLGEFETARSIASDPALEDFRQSGVRFILVIELFRRGHTDEALALLADFESLGLGVSARVHLALGFAGRVPWIGYPYPDW